jgi:hypothetical protein
MRGTASVTEGEVPIDDMPQARVPARAFSPGCGAARLGAAWQEILRTGLGLADGGSGTLTPVKGAGPRLVPKK